MTRTPGTGAALAVARWLSLVAALAAFGLGVVFWFRAAKSTKLCDISVDRTVNSQSGVTETTTHQTCTSEAAHLFSTSHIAFWLFVALLCFWILLGRLHLGFNLSGNLLGLPFAWQLRPPTTASSFVQDSNEELANIQIPDP